MLEEPNFYEFLSSHDIVTVGVEEPRFAIIGRSDMLHLVYYKHAVWYLHYPTCGSLVKNTQLQSPLRACVAPEPADSVIDSESYSARWTATSRLRITAISWKP